MIVPSHFVEISMVLPQATVLWATLRLVVCKGPVDLIYLTKQVVKACVDDSTFVEFMWRMPQTFETTEQLGRLLTSDEVALLVSQGFPPEECAPGESLVEVIASNPSNLVFLRFNVCCQIIGGGPNIAKVWTDAATEAARQQRLAERGGIREAHDPEERIFKPRPVTGPGEGEWEEGGQEPVSEGTSTSGEQALFSERSLRIET